MKLSYPETKKYFIYATDSKKDRNTGQLEVLMPQKRSDTGDLTHVLDIAIGTRVMLTYNINTTIILGDFNEDISQPFQKLKNI